MAGANSVASDDLGSATKSYAKPTVYAAPATLFTAPDEFSGLDAGSLVSGHPSRPEHENDLTNSRA